MSIRRILLPGCAAILVLLELAAYLFEGAAAVAASRLWALHGIWFLGAAAFVILRLARDELRDRRVLCLAALVAAGVLTFWAIRSDRLVPINREATQQVAAGLAHLDRADLGYTRTAFLGYPGRQYVALAVAPRLMGRDVTTLRLGAAILLLLGIGVFAAGLRALQATPEAGDVAGVAILSLFTFPLVVRQLHFYDQTVLPLALTCHAAGFLALCAARFTPGYLLAGLWAIGMLGTCYTPGLAPWAFFVVLLLVLALQRRQQPAEARLWGAGAIFAFGIGACAWITRFDVRYGVKVLPAEALARAGRTLRILLFADPVFFWSPILMLPILLVLLASLAWRTGWGAFLVASWSLAVVFAATLMRGSSSLSVELSLQRAIVVIPLVLALLTLRAIPALGGRPYRLALWAAAIVMCGFSWHLVSQDWKSASSAREAFVADVEVQRRARGWSADDRFVIGMLSAQGELHDVETLAVYFWPKARVARSESDLRQAIEEGRAFVVYADRGYGLPPWVDRIADRRADLDLRGESWPLEMVRASGSPAVDWVKTSGGIQRLKRAALTVGGRRVTVRHSLADQGAVDNLFDGDPGTLLRTRAATTAFVDLDFEAPIDLRGVSVTTSTMRVGLRVLLYRDAARPPRVSAGTWIDAGPDPTVELRFPLPEKGIRRVQLEIANLQGGDGHIHLREIRLLE